MIELPKKLLIIVIPGRAVPKPTMTKSDAWRKRPIVLAYRAWADHIRMQVTRQGVVLPSDQQVTLFSWTAYFKPADSWYKTKAGRLRAEAVMGQQHRFRPDSANILKGLEDILFPAGDSGLACGSYIKLWGPEEYVEIRITYRPEPNAAAVALPAAKVA